MGRLRSINASRMAKATWTKSSIQRLKDDLPSNSDEKLVQLIEDLLSYVENLENAEVDENVQSKMNQLSSLLLNRGDKDSSVYSPSIQKDSSRSPTGSLTPKSSSICGTPSFSNETSNDGVAFFNEVCVTLRNYEKKKNVQV